MAYKIAYKKSVSRDLEKLDKTQARRLLNRIEKDLAAKADTFPVLKGRFAGLRKYRAGDYRIVYAIMDDMVLVVCIGPGRDIQNSNQ